MLFEKDMGQNTERINKELISVLVVPDRYLRTTAKIGIGYFTHES